MKTIEITVGTDGSTHLETKGFQGTDCREASRFLERALGVSGGETLTAEFHQTANTQYHTSERQ